MFQPRNAASHAEEGLSLTREAVDRAVALCEGAGVRLLVILSSCKEHAYYPLVAERLPDETRKKAQPGWLWTRLQEYCEQRGIDCVVLGPVFQEQATKGEQLFFETDAHWNPAGHRLAARTIAARLPREWRRPK